MNEQLYSVEALAELVDSSGVDPALQRLLKLGSPTAILDKGNELLTHYYWKHFNLAKAQEIAQAMIAYAETISHNSNSDLSVPKESFRRILYNLSSFCWPGWREPGIEIGDIDKHIGYEAAKENLRLVHELKKGPIAKARALWLLGAHQLAQGLFQASAESFELSAEHANEAGHMDESLLSHAFYLLSEIAQKPTNDESLFHLRRTLLEMKSNPETAPCTDQVVNANIAFKICTLDAQDPKSMTDIPAHPGR